MNVLVSIILSVITTFSGIFMIPAADLPSYIDEITEENVYQITESAGFVRDTVLVIFEEDASLFDKLSAFKKADGTCVGKISDFNMYIIKTRIDDFEEADKLCRNLTSLDSVLLASICPAKKMQEQYTPDDPFNDENGYWNSDWDDENPEGNNWHIEAIDARSAWGYSSLFSHISLGVIDGGFDTNHEELAGKIVFPSKREERRNRPNHHGTHVAGIIAAEQDNGKGISGICPDSTLICTDWSPSNGQLWIGDLEILNGFKKVVKEGAKVINFSVGSSGSLGDTYKYPSIVTDFDALLYSYAMGSLLQKGYDFVVVQSSGNGNGEGYAVDAGQNGIFCCITEKNAFLPFRDVEKKDLLDRIIIVGSAELSDGAYIQAASSNVGDKVDICAPGVDIFSCTKDNTYLRKSGTSMATPVVTAVAGLVWSVNQELTGAQVKEIVCENTSDEVRPSDERYYDFLNYKTYPLVNAKLAVEAALMKKSGFQKICIETEPNTELIITCTNGKEFVFESDSDGTITCVLPEGEYTIKSISGN